MIKLHCLRAPEELGIDQIVKGQCMKPFSGITKPLGMYIGGLVHGLGGAEIQALLLLEAFSQGHKKHDGYE
eukprot:12894763-Prorocentrum_lima.AAC.1